MTLDALTSVQAIERGEGPRSNRAMPRAPSVPRKNRAEPSSEAMAAPGAAGHLQSINGWNQQTTQPHDSKNSRLSTEVIMAHALPVSRVRG